MRYVGWLIIILFSLGTSRALAQDISAESDKLRSRLKESPIKWQAGLNLTATSYSISGIERRRDPFDYRIQLNGLVDLYGIRVPLNYSYSDGKNVFGYRLPGFNILGLSPSYKWAKLHLGRRSMQFSPYTLNGHTFEGVGLELEPENWYLGIMYGRLQRAVAEDLESRNNLNPTYKRTGYGIKAGYKTTQDELLLTIFAAQDDENSIQRPTQSDIRPQQNSVISLNGKKTLFDKWSLSGEYAFSVLTRDAEMNENLISDVDIRNPLGLIKINSSTHEAAAWNGQVNFEPAIGRFFARYERVDPGYRSLGSLVFNNDRETYSIGAQTSLLNQKLSLGLTGGLERNNLKDNQSNDRERLVLGINSSYQVTERLSLSADYSNFRTTNKTVITTIPIILVDSISLVQTNESINISSGYQLDADGTSMLNGMLSFATFNSIQDDSVLVDSENNNFLASLGYTRAIPDLDVSYGANLNYSQSRFGNDGKIVNITPSLYATKAFLEDKELKLSSVLSYSITDQNEINASVLNWNNNVRYTLQEIHQFTLSASLLSRFGGNESLPRFTEFNARIQYALSLSDRLFSSKPR